ncbi:MAG: PfkB family carbohydrate kinase [Propioniciclava sp.]|uniref:PfkB family carbohydrate kinase n=1 Tax=Propioniciclava sp. TaxID=2038686 RepID=UPI0039E25E4D
MGRVIVLGSINVDLETRVDAYPQPGEKVIARSLARHAGGKGANQAVAARAQGAEVIMVGAVGDDEAGKASLNRLHARGIKLEVDRVPRTPTGHAIVLADGHSNAIAVVPGANALVDARALRAIRGLVSGDILLTQLETPAETVAEAARYAHRYGARVVINLAPYAVLPSDVIEMADPLIVPEADLDAFRQTGSTPASLVVLRGKAGVEWDGVLHPGPIVPDADVVDTVGASDALIGTLVAALVQGSSRSAAARLGLEAAAENVTRSGSQPDPRL